MRHSASAPAVLGVGLGAQKKNNYTYNFLDAGVLL